MPACRAGILRVERAVGEAVERHRRAAREDHAQQDAGELGAERLRRQNAFLSSKAPGERGTGQSERQGEEGMTEADEAEEAVDGTNHVERPGCLKGLLSFLTTADSD